MYFWYYAKQSTIFLLVPYQKVVLNWAEYSGFTGLSVKKIKKSTFPVK